MALGNKTDYPDIVIPKDKKATGKLHDICILNGTDSDMDSDIHKGFTVGKGKVMYWYIIFHEKGYGASIYHHEDGKPLVRRWVPSDTEITVHFK